MLYSDENTTDSNNIQGTTNKTETLSDISNLGIKVGLEIHQQLATGRKLFCRCPIIDTLDHPITFQRRLRPTKGETGKHDPAALFEGSKSLIIHYYANPVNSCLVEQDEEPPGDIDYTAKKTTLIIASALGSHIFEETYAMRKTVVDGSNTTGFQRTVLMAMGGSYVYKNTLIGIQSICLEEDAAKILDSNEKTKKRYGLERLGIPLVEIATAPFDVKDTHKIKDIALTLGRILRSTKMVKRGLGSIRQDVNVSIKDGQGVVVEVKGVQQLDQLADVVTYEAKRQHGLLTISQMIKDSGWVHSTPQDIKDVTKLLSGTCNSKIIINAIKRKESIYVTSFKGMANIFGYSPYENVRLGKDISELVKLFGLGGIFHSDELPNYGITTSDIHGIRKHLKLDSKDAFIIIATPQAKASIIINQIIHRIRQIRDTGIPIDTRLATADGQTKFLRPRPGASRMYPETDVPPIITTQNDLDVAHDNIPQPWDESISHIEKKYGITHQLAEQLWDSPRIDLFEKIISTSPNIKPSFVASVLCSSITSLARQDGLDANLLDDEKITQTFQLLHTAKIPKESIDIIFENIMSGKSPTVQEAISGSMIGTIQDAELFSIVRATLQDNHQLITHQGTRAIQPLMGIAMKKLRGRASGQTVNRLLVEGIKEISDNAS